MVVVSKVITNTNYDDDEYLSAESSVVDAEDLSAAIFDDDEELSAGMYFSLPDMSLDLGFNSQLTEPFFPPMSDHDFLRFYSLDPPLVSGLVLIPKHATERPKIEYVSLSDHPQSKKAPDFAFLEPLNLEILQSCNGLFLCFSPTSESYYISNLTTQQPELLPGSAAVIEHQSALNLAFDPYNSPYYKVISVQRIDQERPQCHQISIYSCETRLWTVSGKAFDAPGDIDFSQGVFCNGAIHWMNRTRKGLYFDVDDEILRNMPKAPVKEGHSLVSCEYFGESNDRLYYAVSSPELPYFELFEMKQDYTGWFFKARIDLQALAANYPLIARRSEYPHPVFGHYECDILSVVQGQDDEDFEVVLSIPGEVIAYNNEKKFATKLCDLNLRPDDRAVWFRVYSAYQVL